MQKVIQQREALMEVTGGALASDKSYWGVHLEERKMASNERRQRH